MAVKTGALKRMMQEAGVREFPNEACGLVIAVGKKSVPIECENISPRKDKKYFMISTKDYTAAADRGEVIGVWHTHPNLTAEPTVGDLVACEKSELPWFIMAIHKNEGDFVFSEITRTDPSGFELPYLERPYVDGVIDCYSLLMDYYKREYGIQLNDYPRILDDGSPGSNLFATRYKKEGFIRLIDKEPEKGDVFLIQISGEYHIAIYIGDDMILHHGRDRLSRRDIYGGGYWHKHTTHHLRWHAFYKADSEA